MRSVPRIAAMSLALALLIAACGTDGATATTDPGADAPTIGGLEYSTFDGVTRSFDEHVGTPLVVNFFAEWCPNCIAEMPDFESVSLELGDGVEFIGLSIDQASDDALALVEATGVTYDVGWDRTEELFDHFEAFAMPATVFVDADGAVAEVWSGALDASALRAKIDETIR